MLNELLIGFEKSWFLIVPITVVMVTLAILEAVWTTHRK